MASVKGANTKEPPSKIEKRMTSVVRKAAGDVLPCVYEMIQGSVGQNGLSSDFILTEKEFVRDGTNGVFECLVAQNNLDITGYLLYWDAFSSLTGMRYHVENCYVVPNFRRKGVATMLYQTFLQECLDRKVASYRFVSPEPEGVLNHLYAKLGVENLTDKSGLHNFKVDKNAILKMKEQKTHDDVRVRQAEISDVATLHENNKEFSKGWGVIKQTLTQAEYKSAMFGPNEILKCLVAETEGQIIGYATYYDAYCISQGRCLYWEIIHVLEGYKRRGVAKHLVSALANICISGGYSHARFVAKPSDTVSAAFDRSIGARDITAEQNKHFFEYFIS